MMGSMDAAETSGGLRLRERASAFLPKGWGDFLLQLFLFTLVDIAYELTRGLSEGSVLPAFSHARDVVSMERSLGAPPALGARHRRLHLLPRPLRDHGGVHVLALSAPEQVLLLRPKRGVRG